jgi:NitT/TauT family transport system ATP-binding protein
MTVIGPRLDAIDDSKEPVSMPRSADIELRDVTHTFTSQGVPRKVLSDFTLSVPAGQFVCLVGTSGCGKTTVLNLLAGLLTADQGLVEVLGGAPDARRRDVGYMFARDALLPWRTAQRNVEFGLELRGVRKGTRAEIARSQLRRVGLSEHSDFRVSELSQGMRQRVALARTWALDPRVLLMDEPFAALDAQTRLAVELEFLKIWQDSDKTVLFVTHDLAEAITLADRVILLGKGQILTDIEIPYQRPRNPAELARDPDFQELYQHLWSMLG